MPVKDTYHRSLNNLYTMCWCYCFFEPLRLWQIANEARSLLQSKYAKKPRNPE